MNDRAGIVGFKAGSTQLVLDDGSLTHGTVIEAGPCAVVGLRTREKDGYDAVRLGHGTVKRTRLSAPKAGEFPESLFKNNLMARRIVEFRVDDPSRYKIGSVVGISELLGDELERVDVVGVSKGRGFTGVIKRWGFKGGPMGHGSKHKRRPGSIGQSATPSRVRKGKKMAGHSGAERVTVRNLRVLQVDTEKNIVVVKGAVPGPNGGVVYVMRSKS